MKTELIVSIISCLALIVSVILIYKKVNQMRKSTMAVAFSKAIDIIQNEDVRKDRGVIFSIMDRPLDQWTKEEKKVGERVCHTYDQVGIMVRAGMFPKELIVDSWGYSLRRLWPILKPLVSEYRIQRDSNEFWDDFEWLSEEAKKFAARKKKRK